MLHLTVVQLNLSNEQKINAAKAMMKDLENEFQSNALCKDDIRISFKGLKTSQFMNPSRASALFLEIDEKTKRTSSYQTLRKIINSIIQAALQRNLVTKNELARSFVQYDQGASQYIVQNFNVSIIQCRKSQRKFNARQIIEKYGRAAILNKFDPEDGKDSAAAGGIKLS